MSFLRSCLAAIFFVAFAIGGLLIGLVLFPLTSLFTFTGRQTLSRRELAAVRRRRLVRASYRLFVWGARVTGLFRVAISPEGRKRLAALRGAVVVANHISLIDVVILIAFLGDTTAVVKVAASRNPFYAHIVRSMFLVNDDPVQVLSDAGRLLRHGVNLIVFPEGTRTPPDSPKRKLHRGAAQISLATNAPLEVIHISSDITVLGKGQPWYAVGSHTITYTLEYRGKISKNLQVNSSDTDNLSRHSASVSLTSQIAAVLFG